MATSVESFLMHRVDAARRLMNVPGKGMEATGRLFLAKRCHEAAKAGQDFPSALASILEDVLESLSETAHEGARLEADLIRDQTS